MNYGETLKYAEELKQYGSVPGLANISALLEAIGNPQEDLQFIHIAGTNGKGSLLAFLSTILSKAGFRVGRYLSPTIFEYRERVQVNGKMISKAGLVSCMIRIREAAEGLVQKGLPHPTAFEMETALAFLYFKEKNCHMVVLETGLGGTLDATNVVKNTIAAVLTPISMDHMDFLGDSLEEIAANKAGIVKEGCRVISAWQKEEVMEVINKTCQQLSCPLQVVCPEEIKAVKYGIKRQSFSYQQYKHLDISLAGTYQISNGALAVEVILQLNQMGYDVSERALRQGLKETLWPGRFSVISQKPFFILDGAHNEAAAARLAESIRFYFTNKHIIYIMGILKDKEYDKIIRETYPYAASIITVTTPGNPRAMPAYELALAVKEYRTNVTAADSLQEAVEMSYLLADKDSVIIAFGSLSYLGEMSNIVNQRNNPKK